ncbi:MAG TPA: hypothetical protein VGM92_07035 [Candidatus Kapabacteria bacterium]|jgi:hypothetical protein
MLREPKSSGKRRRTPLLDSSGVFNMMLGSSGNPLPDAQAMDRPLWLGISIDGAPELRPLSQLSASPFALNVADSSITAQKLNVNYVSSISVDGQPITGRGTNVNIVSGPGLNATWIPTSSSLLLSGTGNGPDAKTMAVGDPWLEGGNYIASPATEFLGSTDSSAIEIHVNDSGYTGNGN